MIRRNTDAELRDLERRWRQTGAMDDCLRWAMARARSGDFTASYVEGDRPWEHGLPQGHRGPSGTRRRIWEASICSGEPLRRTAFFGYDGMQFQGQVEAIASPSAYGLALQAIRDMYEDTEFLFVSHPDVPEPVFRIVLPSGRVTVGELKPTEDVVATRRETMDRSAATTRMLGLDPSTSDDMWRHWNPGNYSSMLLTAMEVSMRIRPPGPRRNKERSGAEDQRDALRNPFLRKPEGKHHGPVAGGVHPYPGFHTASDMDVTAPYAQMKGVDEVDAPDDECEECEGDGCTECAGLYSMPDYPVVIGVDMQGLTPEPDYDAIHLSLDALRVVAGEALGSGENPLDWLDSLDVTDSSELPDSVDGILFDRFTTCVMDPGRCLLSVLEDMSSGEVEQSLREIVKGGKKAKRLAMKVVGQFRYTQDVDDDRLVSVAYMKPFWRSVLNMDEDEEMVEALVAAGWDPIVRDEADTFSPEFKTVWKARSGPGARVEYHGTSYRNLLLAAPWLAAELPVPPVPFKADA